MKVLTPRSTGWIFFLIFLGFFTTALYAHNPQLETVRLKLKWYHQYQFAGYYTALEKGYYKEEGINVVIEERLKNQSFNWIKKVAEGDFEYGVSDAGLIIERLKGKKVTLLAQIFQKSPLAIATLKSSGIKNPEDLYEKKINLGGPSFNAPNHAMLSSAITHNIAYRQTTKRASLEDLIQGKIDAISIYTTSAPYWFKSKGSEINIIRPLEYGIDFYGDNLFTSLKEVKNHPERVEKFIRASIKGWKYALKHREEIANLVYNKFNSQNYTLDHIKWEAKEIEKFIETPTHPLGHFEQHRIDYIAQTFEKLGIVSSSAIPTDFLYSGAESTELFTEEEKRWIKNNPVIKVGSDPSWEPVEFLDPSGGYRGIAIDTLKKVAITSGLKFDFVKKDWQELIRLAKSGEIDLFSAITPTTSRSEYLSFTPPFINIPVGIFAQQNIAYIGHFSELFGKKVAVVEAYSFHEILKNRYPLIELIPVKNNEEGISKLVEGDVHAYIGNMLTTSSLITKKGYKTVRIVGETPFTNALGMGIKKSSPILHSIIHKSLRIIPKQEKDKIYRKWTTLFHTQRAPFNYTLLWQGVVITAIAFLLFLVWNRKLAKEVSKQTKDLNESNRKLREAQKIAKLGHWEQDFKSQEIDWSAEVFSIFELPQTSEVILYESFSFRIHPEDREQADNNYFQAIKHTNSFEHFYRLLFEDGRVKYVHDEGFIERNDQGIPERIVGTIHDITSIKEVEEELMQEKKFTDTVINALPSLFMVYQEGQGIIKWNHEVEALTGFSGDEIKKKSSDSWFYSENHNIANEIIKNTLRNHHDQREIEIITKDKLHIPLLFSSTLLEDQDKKFIISTGIDISELKKAEDKLKQAQKMEAIGTLAGGIAHDFNNMLSAILGYTQLAEHDLPKNSTVRKDLQEVYNAGIRAKELVKQILAFSRQSQTDLNPLKIQAILKEALKLLRATIPTTIEFKLEINNQVGSVLADATQMHQVIINLCTNAYHAMKDSGGVLGIIFDQIEIPREFAKGELQLAPGSYAHLTITDTGTGIHPDLMEKIFEPYFSTKEQGEGTGLGLAVVQGIITSLNGQITGLSKLGKGSEFHIYLPIDQQETVSPKNIIKKEMPAGNNERILIVDDELSVVKMEKKLLQNLGYQTTAFACPVEAWEAFKENEDLFDLVITDMTMPGLTGLQLAGKILKLKPDIPVIICTGYSEHINEENFTAHGIKKLLMKPVLHETFAKIVREALDSR